MPRDGDGEKAMEMTRAGSQSPWPSFRLLAIGHLHLLLTKHNAPCCIGLPSTAVQGIAVGQVSAVAADGSSEGSGTELVFSVGAGASCP